MIMRRSATRRVLLLCFTLYTAYAGVQGPAAGVETEEAPRFDILEYRVEGNTVLTTLEVERAVYGYLGPERTIKDVEAARSALEQSYHKASYLTVFVDIPEQTVAQGIIRLRVTEGRVERSRVTGSRYYSLGEIRRRTPSLAEGSVPHFSTVQQELAQLNKSPDRRVTPVLKPGRTPGRVEVDLKVDDKLPLHGGVELNDRYSGETSRLRLGASLRYDNLWQREHSIAVQAQTSPQDTDEVRVLSGTYLFPAWGDTLIAAYAVRSRSNAAAVGALNVIGSGTIYGIRSIIPLRSFDGWYHSVTLGLDYKDFSETVSLIGADSFDTPISYAPLIAQYNATAIAPGSLTQLDASATAGVRGLLGNNDAEFENKRFKASASYLALKAGAGWTRNVAGPFDVHARFEAQGASGPLVSNEQFGIGGAESVRGYRELEALGDDGARMTVEVRRAFGERKPGGIAETYVAGFVDAGWARIEDPLPGQRSRFTLASAGIGLRLKDTRGLALALDLAQALRAGPSTRDGDSRIHFRLSYEF
ncbi:MAG: BamA/TamA family outer membrane protein [Betaproteobacteria bacterium]|nr:BamA/TamA family outer membrane protein [Betaproteobacteria bacterium]